MNLNDNNINNNNDPMEVDPQTEVIVKQEPGTKEESIEIDDDNTEPPHKKYKSDVWNYFTKIGNSKAQCNLCYKEYLTKQGCTTALRRHYAAIHNSQGESSVKTDIKAEKTIVPLESTSTKAQALTQAIAYMMCKDFQPLNIVDNQGFKYLMSVAEPRYTIPHRTTFSRNIIPSIYDEEVKRIRIKLTNDLKDVNILTFTTDGWTSRATDGFISLTIHYINKNFECENIVLNNRHITGSHTAVNLEKYMEELLKEWNIDIKDKKIIWVTDNAKNMIKAVELNKEWIRIPCFAHTLQLSVKDCKKQMPKVDDLVKAASTIVTHFSKSTSAAEMLEDVQKKLNPNDTPLKLIQQVETRWNSQFDMFLRLLQLRVPVEAVTTEKKIVKRLAEEDWVLMEIYTDIFKPIKEATLLLSGEKYSTASQIIPVVNLLIGQLQSRIDNSNGTLEILSQNLLESLKSRFQKCLQSKILMVAMIVNPHYKDKIINSDCDRKIVIDVFTDVLMTKVKSEATNQPSAEIKKDNATNENDTKTNTLKSLLQARINSTQKAKNSIDAEIKEEIARYLNENCIPFEDCILTWWRNNHTYPSIKKLAFEYLGIVGTQVPSERVFSTSGNIVTTDRSKLLTEIVELLSFLHYNWNISV